MRPWHVIGCPVDFSEPSREAMHLAAELASSSGARLMLIYVRPLPPLAFAEAPSYSAEEMLQQVDALADRSLAEWRAEALTRGAPVVQTRSLTGAPHAEIVRFARENDLDLLVMGTHGRTALMRAVLGSVAEKVVRRAPCPVLTVHAGQAKASAQEAEPSSP
jgi:nucleotide-binding universal stress UspA family protein